MAWAIGTLDITLTSESDFSSKQYYFCKIGSADNSCALPTALTDVPLGIVQNTPTSGQAATVRVLGVSKVSTDTALSAGNLIGTSADGQADAKTVGSDTTHYVAGQMLDSPGAAADLGTALINCCNPHRAA